MTNLDTKIGVLCLSYEYSPIVTVQDLKEELEKDMTCYSPKEYCDWRYSTNLTRFVYDPCTGEKIDWGMVRELLS